MNKKRTANRGYIGNCVSLPAQYITAMVESSKEIRYRRFIAYVPSKTLSDMFGTSPKIKDDYHVRYYVSRYNGKPCCYIVHSAIEYVFVDNSIGFTTTDLQPEPIAERVRVVPNLKKTDIHVNLDIYDGASNARKYR